MKFYEKNAPVKGVPFIVADEPHPALEIIERLRAEVAEERNKAIQAHAWCERLREIRTEDDNTIRGLRVQLAIKDGEIERLRTLLEQQEGGK